MEFKFLQVLNEITVKSIDLLFSKSFSSTLDSAKNEGFTIEKIPSFKCRFYVQIGLRNKDFQCSLILGLNDDAISYVLKDILSLTAPGSQRDEILKSALGELTNVIACDFCALEIVEKEVGRILPTPPLVWVANYKIPDFSEGDGISGVVIHDEIKIFTHFSIKKLKDLSDNESQSWCPTESLSIYDPNSKKLF